MKYNKFVYLFTSYKNWILHGMAKDAARAAGISINTIFIPQKRRDLMAIGDVIQFLFHTPPKANSLFLNHTVFLYCLERYKKPIEEARVFFTHNSTPSERISELSQGLSKAQRIFTYNSNDKKFLEELGIEPEKIKVLFGGVDRKIFYPKSKKEGDEFVLIVGDCKERKRPYLVLDVISKTPNLNFVIHGRGWESLISNASKLQNLKYVSFNFQKHPEIMRSASAYLSLSSLEGGPFPTLEALASGTPVVATDTGWNREVVPEDGGVVLPNNPTLAEVQEAIFKCVELKKANKGKDLLQGKYTWLSMAKEYFAIEQ